MFRFRPLPLALGLTSVLGALALAHAATAQYETRREALQRAAQAKREQLHLSVEAACLKDSTPEVSFRTPVKAHPGEHVHLVIPGTFHGQPQGVFTRDDVTITSQKYTAHGLELDAQISPHALPGEAELLLQRELCDRADPFQAIEVVSKTHWEVKYPNGWTVQLTCAGERRKEDDTNCDAVWTGQGGPKTTRATLSGHDRYFSAEYRLTPKESELIQQQMDKLPKAPPPELMAALQKAQGEINKCGRLAQDKMMPCIQAASAETQRLTKEFEAKMKKLTPPPGPPVIGCNNSAFTLDGTTVTATGSECGKAGANLEGGIGTLQVQG